MSGGVNSPENKWMAEPQECPQACKPVTPPPKPGRHSDEEEEHDEELIEGQNSGSYSSEDNAVGDIYTLGKTKHQFEKLVYEKDLADITCACGHGYFKPDKTWIAGSDVRAGVAPPKPQSWA
ncbi:unnamed protein product [Alternaria alternata]